MSATKELRGLAPADLVQALDAFALAQGKDRTTYVNEVLLQHVRARCDELTVLTRMLDGNPLLTEPQRSVKE
jgi:hypothetical protein